MSWSFYKKGKASEVATAAEEAKNSGFPCAEPEETVRQFALNAVVTATGSYPEDSEVNVEASGSMSMNNGVCISNYLNIKVEPVPAGS